MNSIEVTKIQSKKDELLDKGFNMVVPDRDMRSPKIDGEDSRRRKLSKEILGPTIVNQVYDEEGYMLEKSGTAVNARSAGKRPSKERRQLSRSLQLPPSTHDFDIFKDRDKRDEYVDNMEIARQIGEEVFGPCLVHVVYDQDGQQLMPNPQVKIRSGSKESADAWAPNPDKEAPTERERTDWIIEQLFEDRTSPSTRKRNVGIRAAKRSNSNKEGGGCRSMKISK